MGDNSPLTPEPSSRTALSARYLNSPPPKNPPSNPILNAIWNHKSVRRFLPTPLPSGTLEALIAAGQSASTSSMLQTWTAVAVQDPVRKDAAAKLSGDQDFIRQAPLMLFFCADLSRLTNVSKWEDKAGKALDNMDMFIMASIDASLAAQNVSLAAESLGLGICYVGAARNNATQLSELLGLPQRAIAMFGMAVGTPDPAHLPEVKPRLPMREVLHHETWDETGQKENVESYNGSLGAFYEWRQLVGRHSWATFVSGMLASGELDGRERIRQVLLDRGFGLE